MSCFPYCAAIFLSNRRQKRAYTSLQSDKICMKEILKIEESQGIGGNQLQMISMTNKENFIIGLTKSGQVYIWGEFAIPIPQEDNQQQIIQSTKSISKDIPQYLSYEGTLYAWGNDSEQKYGILGLGQQYKALRPCPISSLFDYMIKSLSLAETHACAVDSNGRLFCWGYGPNGELGLESQGQSINVPTIITKQKQINIKKAICHNSYTAFCSGAGYVFLFGTLHSSIGKMHSSYSKFPLASQPMCLQKSNSQMNFDQNKANPLLKSTNRPLNSMCQIMSLSEIYIQDMLGGEGFLVCTTSNGDMYFVDDSLESVQINTVSIDSVAIAGSKILGLSKNDKLYEWSTAGLNKLSFNKENKLLLRQDLQMKEYQIKPEFAQNIKLCNLPQSKLNSALFFEDLNNIRQQFQSQKQDDYDLDNQQIVIAELIVQNVRQSHFNPIHSESSVNISQEKEELSPSSFNNTTTPEVSITAAQDFQPSFKITEEHQIDDCTLPSHFLSEKDINNIFHYPTIQQQQTLQPTTYQQPTHQQLPSFQFIQNSMNPTQFFFENEANEVTQNPQRPSSIKSCKQTSNQSHSSHYNNSNASLKQCAADMQPLGGRSSKIEISFPSFLTLSGEKVIGQEKERSQSLSKQEVKKQEQNNNFEFSIKLFPNEKSLSESESREASIVREYIEDEEGKQEESMIITMSNLKIQAKTTSTPKRLLNSYSQSKRSIITITPSDQNPMTLNQESNQKSQEEEVEESELSNEFNLTTVQSNIEGRYTIYSQTEEFLQQPQISTNFQQYQHNKKKHNNKKKLSNSCGSHGSKKKSSFIQALLQQKQQKHTFDIKNDPASVTQIYNTSPFNVNKDDKKLNDVTQERISEEDANLMMSSSSNPHQEWEHECQPQFQQQIGISQNEDNFEVDYFISNSCTPQSSSSIKRRINFDDASGENGAIIQSENNRTQITQSFRISANSQQQVNSQSFVFQQCQSPQPVQAFNEDHLMSNSNTTHMMMLTEEKFKNLKSEISQVENQNQFLITQNTLLSSPLLQNDSKSQLIGTSHVQNFSSFIRQSKYLQVYENFRRGFQKICRIRDQRVSYSLKKLKRYNADEKQRKEFIQGMAKFLFNTLKTHIQNQKLMGFKRIKKFYKEKQLQVYIRQKQNEFVVKANLLSKVEFIIQKYNKQSIECVFESLKQHYLQIKQQLEQKRKKKVIQLVNIISRKIRINQENSFKCLSNWVKERKIMEINIKMLMRAMQKVYQQHAKINFTQFKEGVKILLRRKQSLLNIFNNQKKKALLQYRNNILVRKSKIQSAIKSLEIYRKMQERMQIKKVLSKFQLHTKRIAKIIQLSEMLKRNNEKLMIQLGYSQFKKEVKRKIQLQKKLKIEKALLLLLFSKLSEKVKSNLRQGFQSISKYALKEDTFLINKSQTNSNLSFNFNQLLQDPSMIMSRKECINTAYYTTESRNIHQSLSKSNSQGIQKSYYMTNQDVERKKKVTLNDYLSFSPKDAEMMMASKFQQKTKNESNTQDRTIDKSYLDCPLPIQCYQDKLQKKQKQKQQSQNSILSVSIRDLNKAFKDQVSRIKEKEEESQSLSFNSYGNSSINQQQLKIEMSQTPEMLVRDNQATIQISRNKSPQINPLCTSESYGGIQCFMGNQQISQEGGLHSQQYKISQKQNHEGNDIIIQNLKAKIQDKTKEALLSINMIDNENLEDEELQEDKFAQINITDNPMTFRDNKQEKIFIQSSNKIKSPRYQYTEDFSIDFEQSHDMFDEFDCQEKEQKLTRFQSAHNISTSFIKNSIADLSKNIAYSNNYYQEQESYDQASKIMPQYNKIQNFQESTSPKFNESFIPPITRQALNEMAANYQMELTPEADIRMLLNNKSMINKEESIYSNNQYADPVEMTLSPRPQTGSTPIQNQVNYCFSTIQSQQKEQSEDISGELSQILEKERDSKPYDFQLSSNSKYKIVSENQMVKNILKSETAQPSMIVQHQGICKKLSFGYDVNKRNQNNQINQAKQRSTLLVSGGEQTINFNLTEEDEDDEDFDVGEEIPTEKRSRRDLALPQSKIMQQEQQEEKSVRLSHKDLRIITQNRMQKLNAQSYQMTERENSKSKKNLASDFISQNIDRLRNIVKLSPRYGNGESQFSSANSSTRNLNQRSFGFGTSKSNNQQQSFESTQNSFMVNYQPKKQQSSYILTQRNQSKENISMIGRNNSITTTSAKVQNKISHPKTQRGPLSYVQRSIAGQDGFMNNRLSCKEPEMYMSTQDLNVSSSQSNLFNKNNNRNTQDKLTTFLTMGNKVMSFSSQPGQQQHQQNSSLTMRRLQ